MALLSRSSHVELLLQELTSLSRAHTRWLQKEGDLSGAHTYRFLRVLSGFSGASLTDGVAAVGERRES
jgi:hypothetical protein